MEAAAEIIREARNVLFERGWYQGEYEGPDGSVCLRGACNIAATSEAKISTGLSYFAETYIAAVAGCEWTALHLWNDAPERTFGDVIDALDRAEKIAEQRESEARDV